MQISPLRPGLVPPFHELGEDAFEDLCRELVQEEEGIDNADRYGTRGQRQFGVDLLIDRTDGSLWVGQCKSHKECDAALIRKACDTFLKHADYWSGKGVTKFLLFLAADTRRRELHDERLCQRVRLRDHGFSFSVWSAAALKSKLRKHRRIVHHFLPYLVDFICGPSDPFDIASTPQTLKLLSMGSQYGERVTGEHIDLLRLWREGHPKEALRKLHVARAETSLLGTLLPRTEAKLVHLEGRLLVAAGDVAGAKRLVTSSPKSDVSGNARLVAMIAQAEDRLDDAIVALEGHDDPDSRTLRAAIHLQKGQDTAAATVLSQLENHPDAHRLRAIMFAGRGEVSKAKLEAERALHLAPSWYWMKRTAATIRYLSGLSPVVIPKGLPEWPPPITYSLVRQDKESLAERRAAAREFEALSAPQFDHESDDSACLDAWRVACLVDDPSSRQRAMEVAAASLETRPENYRVMLWILARGLEVPIDRSTRVLETKVDGGQATFEESIALVAAYAATDNVVMAADVLERTRRTFTAGRELEVTDFWHLQLGRLDAKSSATLASVNRRADDAVARLRAAIDNEDHLASWDQYMILAQLGQWNEIAAAASDLISVFKTPDAARLACHALYNVGDTQGCLSMLRRARAVFFDDELSVDLRQLQAAGQRDAGALSDAIRDVRDVFEETGAADTFMELARLYFQVADLKNIAIIARQYDAVHGLAGVDYLILSSYLKVEDRALALTLWKKAIAEGVSDEYVGLAFEIGNNLAVDCHLDTLARRLVELGHTGKGGVERVGVAELVKRIEAHHQHVQELSEMLRRGTLPVHLFSQATGIPLASIRRRFRRVSQYHMDKRVNAPHYQRFGGRIQGGHQTVEGERWRLNADITALLTAAHFRFLPRIETEYGTIRIPQHTVVALNAMQDGLRPNQPDRIEAERKIIGLTVDGILRSVELEPVTVRSSADGDIADHVLAALRRASKANALVVDFLPPLSTDPERVATGLPDQYQRLLRDAHSVLDALLHCGAVSGEEHMLARRSLGARTVAPMEMTIEEGTELLCGVGVLVVLATAGVLEVAAEVFELTLTAGELESTKVDIYRAGQDASDAEWIDELVEHIRAGLETGRYEFLPRVRHDESADGGREQSDLEKMLGDLLRCDGHDRDALWIDDRCLNAHSHSEGKRIVDTVDLLYDLRRRERLSEEELFEALTQMRGADSRFIAFSAEELLNALRAGSVVDGVLVETKQLRVLRRYYARCLLEADALRPPGEYSERPGADTEWHFLMECGRAVLLAMVRLWRTGPDGEREARANWLLHYMFTEDRGFHGTSMLRGTEANAHATALAITSLLTRAVELDTGGAERPARDSYCEWLDRQILRDRLHVDRTVEATVAGQLREVLAGDDVGDARVDRRTAGALMARLWMDWPERIRDLTASDQEFARRFGLSARTEASIGPLQVESRILWSSLSEVLNEGISTAVESVDGETFTVELISTEPIMFGIRCPAADIDLRVVREDFVFLSESLSVRESAAAQAGHLLDLRRDRRDELVATIVAAQDPSTRMEAMSAARASSGANFYRGLAARLQEGQVFRSSDAMPSNPGMLVEHLRIEEGDTPSTRWERAVGRLLEDVGIVETAVRICGLPVRTPKAFVDAACRLSTEDREGSFRRVRKIWSKSPIGVVRIAETWNQVFGSSRRTARMGSRVARALCDAERKDTFEAWRTVLWRGSRGIWLRRTNAERANGCAVGMCLDPCGPRVSNSHRTWAVERVDRECVQRKRPRVGARVCVSGVR